MDKSKASDADLIAALKQGGQAADGALSQIYRDNRAAIGQLILKNQGDQEAAKDIMQDAMIALYENVREGRYKGQSSLGTYLYAIARLMWLNRLKRHRLKAEKLAHLPTDLAEPALPLLLLEEESLEAVTNVLDLVGASCKQLLIDSIYFGEDMKSIARKMQYGSEQVARNKKYRCLKKLKKLIQDRPHLLNLLSNN